MKTQNTSPASAIIVVLIPAIFAFLIITQIIIPVAKIVYKQLKANQRYQVVEAKVQARLALVKETTIDVVQEISQTLKAIYTADIPTATIKVFNFLKNKF